MRMRGLRRLLKAGRSATSRRSVPATPTQRKTAMIGYTLATVLKNKQADGKLSGVKIGRACIKKNISVNKVAQIAGVTKITVYAWFKGEYSPRPETAKKIQNYIDRH